jgi:hypothetical protein
LVATLEGVVDLINQLEVDRRGLLVQELVVSEVKSVLLQRLAPLLTHELTCQPKPLLQHH